MKKPNEVAQRFDERTEEGGSDRVRGQDENDLFSRSVAPRFRIAGRGHRVTGGGGHVAGIEQSVHHACDISTESSLCSLTLLTPCEHMNNFVRYRSRPVNFPPLSAGACRP